MTTATPTTENSQIWDLDSIFAGGSQSPDMEAFISALTGELTQAATGDLPGPLTPATQPAWVAAIVRAFDLLSRLHQVSAFAGCLVAQDVNDTLAMQVQARLDQLGATADKLRTRLAAAMAAGFCGPSHSAVAGYN